MHYTLGQRAKKTTLSGNSEVSMGYAGVPFGLLGRGYKTKK